MTEVYIKYNPFRLQTDINVDGQVPKRNSRLNFGERRLQEWVDMLPGILCEECGSRQFTITFCGTDPDYEDMVAMAEEACHQGINVELKHVPSRDVKDREVAIKKLFRDIQDGPFPELKQDDIVQAFESASNSDFMVSVVATMSAGKSTLINALLAQKLMPAKQEACTATIVEIKDNDEDHFCARAFDKDGQEVESVDPLTYQDMRRLNSNPDVSRISVEGDIPFVPADDIALVLVDTPGPNNSRDINHRKVTQGMLLASAKPLVLYIMNATQLAVDDDDSLLKLVAGSMKVGGKQSRDRFIFVVNKLDAFNKGEDSVDAALKKVRSYLADHGIENPSIYPASALTALNVRTILADGEDDDEDAVYEAIGKVRKLNRNEELHFEKYAPLPLSARSSIEARLEAAVAQDDRNAQALIHSGIISLEEAIRLYVEKYATTAKIKNIVDTFVGKIEEARYFAKAEEQIRQNESLRQGIVERIVAIEDKLKRGEEAKAFLDEVLSADHSTVFRDEVAGVIREMQERIDKAAEGREGRLSEREASGLCNDLTVFAKRLQADVQVRLEDLLVTNMQSYAERLLSGYKEKLSNLANDVAVGGVSVDPFKMMIGELPGNTSTLIASFSVTESVKTGEQWVINQNRSWWKPWTWFAEKGHFEELHEEQLFVEAEALTKEFLQPIREQLQECQQFALDYAAAQAQRIKESFLRNFDALDERLREKLGELKKCAEAEKVASGQIATAAARLDWLNDIQAQMDAILSI